ncbi:MAG: ferredoxin [Zetaproteobacteria bacterium CG12_big_fil_rev_8_21_14_0_65_54_13]|nr:MAG: ferredoxin [Zetaproteobacteria bacterium CG12_big_fil_rev_8_21_14_0_65_54_13]PIX55183.1 MAG: ferredoxin [Zetaproteobacteria bacterium CG_4_10_14_3_um_filter_54_28]PJA28474.1 MAG: ferredoxin [Zetaproteobacteria bacterium CG_4_9_14_3_um_filter_54_145]
MSPNESLKQIPVQQEHVAGATKLHAARRAVQYLTLLVLVVIPMSGLFRIDPQVGGFIMLDRQVWFSDIFIVMGFWVFIASLLVMMYSLVGSVFCGWMCPQNTVSEYANMLTEKLLGRRAQMMDMSGDRMTVASRKQSPLNYVLLAIGLLLPAMFFALIPLLYFYPPSAIWSLITFSEDTRLAGSLHWIYMVCVAIFMLDIVVIRHLMCKYMCIYRVWQHSFKTKETLHIHYDIARSDHCATCHYCVDSCFLDIDPRQTEVFDSCVNCGECITACDELHTKSKKLAGPGLLSFAIGDKDKPKKSGKEMGSVASFFARARVSSMATVIGAVFFMIGIAGYQNNEFSVYRSEAWHGAKVLDYRINVAHKLYHPTDITLRIEGLDPAQYQLQSTRVRFDTAGRKDVALHVIESLPKGLYRFRVYATSTSGWSGVFDVTHFAPGS